MNSVPQPPFEIHPQGVGGFTSFEIGSEIVALPLLAVIKASLRGTVQQEIIIEFPKTIARVSGTGLGEVFAYFLTGRVRVLRRGQHGVCTINGVQILDS
jgi:hypothetical protein